MTVLTVFEVEIVPLCPNIDVSGLTAGMRGRGVVTVHELIFITL